jgi:hypothetical protein
MRITQVRVGRVFNTGNYTNHRFEFEADIDEDESPTAALDALAATLQTQALISLKRMGVDFIYEGSGTKRIATLLGASEGDDDDIPF